MKPAELDTYAVAYVDGLIARVADLEAEKKGASVALESACNTVDRFSVRVAELEERCKRLVRAEDKWRDMRAAGDALACYVAADARGQTARRLVEAWEEVSR